MRLSPTGKKQLIAGGLVAAVLAVGAAAIYGRFSYSSVCRQCGAVRDTAEWQVPLTSATVIRNSTERDTPVSRTLQQLGLVLHHEHQWLFVAGGGNFVRCAIGEGHSIFPSLDSDGVARLLESVNEFGEIEFRDKVLCALFDPAVSEEVRGLGLSFPTNGFAQRAELHSWIAGNTVLFDEMVAARKERAKHQ
jgi:hypothetical protein